MKSSLYQDFSQNGYIWTQPKSEFLLIHFKIPKPQKKKQSPVWKQLPQMPAQLVFT
jgi:hypothetical protein